MAHIDYGENRGGENRPLHEETAAGDRKNPVWQRLLFGIGFAIVAYVLLWLIFALAILQWVVSLVAGSRNQQLADFGARLGIYLRDIVRYLTAASDTLPFPFTSFPEAEAPPAPGTTSSL